jgi:hypothetical protein
MFENVHIVADTYFIGTDSNIGQSIRQLLGFLVDFSDQIFIFLSNFKCEPLLRLPFVEQVPLGEWNIKKGICWCVIAEHLGPFHLSVRFNLFQRRVSRPPT